MGLRGQKRLEDEKLFIRSQGKITVAEMSERWGITEETARRDLDKLQLEGVVTRIHGGAIWNAEKTEESVQFLVRRRKNLEAKKKIAYNARDLIRRCGTLMADSSTTVIEALRLVSDESNLLVVTNSTIIYELIAELKYQVISTGGIFNRNPMSFQGELTKQTINRYNARLALMSCKGLDMQKGILDSYESEADIKKTMLNRAEEVAILADHTKFDRTAFLQLTDFDHIDYLITDIKPSDEWVRFLADHNVQLIY
jgi:DeoR/GlpR family transcriptional regulator of sugar metabolism